MRRYLRVFLLHAQGSLMAALEYRVGFLTALGMSLIDALWAVGGAWVFYAHRPTLGGWRFEETLVVVGLFFLASGFLDALLQPNLRLLIERIRTGQLDYMLIRPLNPMAYATMQRQRFAVPPGMTGGWQVNGRSDRPMHLHVEDDLLPHLQLLAVAGHPDPAEDCAGSAQRTGRFKGLARSVPTCAGMTGIHPALRSGRSYPF